MTDITAAVDAYKNGARAVDVVKAHNLHPPQLYRALRAAGVEIRSDSRKQVIAQALKSGEGVSEIATRLGVTVSTVKKHAAKNIFLPDASLANAGEQTQPTE